MIKNLVSVRRIISSNKSQNLVIFESSKGASTSSKTHNGAGFARKTANIKANAVSVCSPPDNNDNVAPWWQGIGLGSFPLFKMGQELS